MGRRRSLAMAIMCFITPIYTHALSLSPSVGLQWNAHTDARPASLAPTATGDDQTIIININIIIEGAVEAARSSVPLIVRSLVASVRCDGAAGAQKLRASALVASSHSWGGENNLVIYYLSPPNDREPTN